MYIIHKITQNTTVDFAAEELKKYLRMMMPRCGEISIDYDTRATAGFRLGLMQTFGLDLSDAADPSKDDVVYLDTDENGGVIAGSNPGALLIAVYRYLRFCGCRWLFPGVDGEKIPVIESLPPVTYRKLADHRYRGQCNEGAEYQQSMMESIDFTPKIGLNTYMLEFDNPYVYYSFFYDHLYNSMREKESVSHETVLQWKRQCEVEIQKRGLRFHDMGHGWTVGPFGIDTTEGWVQGGDEPPADVRQHFALVDGKRRFFQGVPLNTNNCMSNPETRRIIAEYVADYAEKQNNVDFLHIWLADGNNNHCECENCRKKRASDWYVVLLNDIDAELTRRKLNTHLVFIQYYDTFWGPVEEVFNNPDRFTMLYAPITRLYCESYMLDADESQVEPYVLNKHHFPQGMAACLGYLHKEWKPVWKGDCFCYEYHFWIRQFYDPTGLHIARLIHEDIRGLKKHGLDGIVEDGSQRSFFPNGLAFYVYGETLFDSSVEFDDLLADYYRHAYGEKWRDVLAYLERLSACFDHEYMAGHRSLDLSIGKAYNPAMAEQLAGVSAVTRAFAPVIEQQRKEPMPRACTIAWKLLQNHADFVDYLAEVAMKRAVGDNLGAIASEKRFRDDFSRREIELQPYYDQFMVRNSYRGSGIFERSKKK